jgi:hypothetical protein
MLPQHPAAEVSAREIDKNILTSRVECEDNLAPGDGFLLSFTEYMLSKEQQEATSVVIDGSSVLLYHTDTFDDVRKMELFTTGEKRYLRLAATSSVTVSGSLSSEKST